MLWMKIVQFMIDCNSFDKQTLIEILQSFGLNLKMSIIDYFSLFRMFANIAPLKLCHTEKMAPGSVAIGYIAK